MVPFSGIPFLRFLFAFVSGIFFYLFFQPAKDYSILSIVSIVAYLLIYFIQAKKRESFYVLNSYLGLMALLALFFAGSSFTYWKDDLNNPYHLTNILQKGDAYEAIVVSNPEEKANSFKVELNIRKFYRNDSTFYVTAGSYLYLSKRNSSKNQLTYGDKVVIKGWPEEIKGPMNPFEFDYKKRTKFIHIYHQHFINSKDFKVVGENAGNSIVAFAFFLRRKADEVIRKYVSGVEEQNIASALLLGLKNTLSQELKDIYSSTGTTHVLAVSGMHVTVLCQLLMSLFLLVNSRKFKNFILPVFLLTALWLYVLITGFSPSVLRAGVMFSLIIIGNLLGKNGNIYNSVLVSAFGLLCYDPFMIMDIGFQLSYLAVIGLLFFANRIYTLKVFKNVVADFVWNMLSVSIAAQIITLPLCIYYFHQIPVSALVSNLIAVPISTGLLYLGIVLLICSFVPILPEIVGYVVGKLIQLMNFSLELISSFDMSSITGINLGLLQIGLIYIIILSVTVFVIRRKYGYFIISCILLITFFLSLVHRVIEVKNQEKIIVYNIRNKKVVAFIKGTTVFFEGDSLSKDDFRFHIEPSIIGYGIDSICQNVSNQSLSVHSQPEFDLFVFQKKSFLITKRIDAGYSLPAAEFVLANRKDVPKLNARENSQLIVCSGGSKSLESDVYYDMNSMPAMVIELE